MKTRTLITLGVLGVVGVVAAGLVVQRTPLAGLFGAHDALSTSQSGLTEGNGLDAGIGSASLRSAPGAGSGSPAGSSSGAPPQRSLAEAIQASAPNFQDTSGALDRGTASLAMWAVQGLTAEELAKLPSTSAALFRKDPDEERGRRICIEGVIEEIRAERDLGRRLVIDRSVPLVALDAKANDRPGMLPMDLLRAANSASLPEVPVPQPDTTEWLLPSGKVFFAIIAEPITARPPGSTAGEKPLVVEALAVGSSGDLVDGDWAKFCGVLTGVTLLSASADPGRLIHRAVGLFDLKASKHPPATQQSR